MTKEDLKREINKAGIANAMSVIDLDAFTGIIDENKAEDAVDQGCFYRFLQSIIQRSTFPASWQKLSDLGWADDEVTCLVDSNLLEESATTLMATISSGALSINEFNEFAGYPNQEVNIFYFTENSQKIIAWLNDSLPVPKVDEDTFVGQ